MSTIAVTIGVTVSAAVATIAVIGGILAYRRWGQRKVRRWDLVHEQSTIPLLGLRTYGETNTESLVGSEIQLSAKLRKGNDDDKERNASEGKPAANSRKTVRLPNVYKTPDILDLTDIKTLPFGLNLIYDPHVSADCNIMFVHGFFGDTYSTWVHNSGAFWIKDSLPNKMPNARIWIYSYSTKAASGKSYKTIRDYARELLMEFLAKRIDKVDSRSPWVFVCHCTAGFLVAEAFAKASLSDSSVFSSFRSVRVRGIVFLSTPFNGIPIFSGSWWTFNVSQWFASWLSSSATRMLLEYAKTDKQVLRALKTRLETMALDRIVSFYDTQGTRFSRPLYDESTCALGFPQEVAMPSRQFSLNVSFQDDNDVDFKTLLRAIESCVYDPPSNVDNALVIEPLPVAVSYRIGPLTVLHEDGPPKALHDGGPVKVVQGYGTDDSVSEITFKSRSLPDVTVSAQNPVSSMATSSEPTILISSSMQIPNSLEASKAFLRAAADTPPGLSVPFQYWAGALAGTGILATAVIGGVNANTARIAAEANVKSAEAAMLSSQVAEKKLLFDMRKELEDDKKANDTDANQKQPRPDSSKPGSTTDRNSALGSTRIVASSSNTNAQSDRLKQEAKNLRKMKEDLERSSMNRRLAAQNHAQPQKLPHHTEDSKLSGRLQQLRSKLLGAQPRSQVAASRKGKEKATDQEAIPIDFLELDDMNVDTTAVNKHLPDLLNGQTLNVFLATDTTDGKTDLSADDGSKEPLQMDFTAQAEPQADGDKIASATIDVSGTHSDCQESAKVEGIAECQANGNAAAPATAQTEGPSASPLAQNKHQSSLPGQYVPAKGEEINRALSGAIDKTGQDVDDAEPDGDI